VGEGFARIGGRKVWCYILELKEILSEREENIGFFNHSNFYREERKERPVCKREELRGWKSGVEYQQKG